MPLARYLPSRGKLDARALEKLAQAVEVWVVAHKLAHVHLHGRGAAALSGRLCRVRRHEQLHMRVRLRLPRPAKPLCVPAAVHLPARTLHTEQTIKIEKAGEKAARGTEGKLGRKNWGEKTGAKPGRHRDRDRDRAHLKDRHAGRCESRCRLLEHLLKRLAKRRPVPTKNPTGHLKNSGECRLRRAHERAPLSAPTHEGFMELVRSSTSSQIRAFECDFFPRSLPPSPWCYCARFQRSSARSQRSSARTPFLPTIPSPKYIPRAATRPPRALHSSFMQFFLADSNLRMPCFPPRARTRRTLAP